MTLAHPSPRKVTLLLALAGVYLLNVAAQVTAPMNVVPICDVLRDPSLFDGKVIAVRGEHIVGGHGLYLGGRDCPDGLTTKGYRWPSLIWIVNIEEEMERRGYAPSQYMRALREIDNVSRGELQRKGAGAKIARVEVTFVGLFETHHDFENAVFQRPDGTIVGAGFGQVPGAPGQLFVQSAKDVSVQFESSSKP
jgi:hypothetical protein